MLGSLTSGGFALVLRLTLNRLLGRFLGRRLERVEVRGDAIELRDVALDAAALGNAVAPPGCVVESCTVDRLVRAPRVPGRARAPATILSAPSVRHLRRDGCVLRLEGVRVVAAPRVAPRPNALSRLGDAAPARAGRAAAAAAAGRPTTRPEGLVARATRAVGAWAEGVAERTSVVVAGAAVVFDDFEASFAEVTAHEPEAGRARALGFAGAKLAWRGVDLVALDAGGHATVRESGGRLAVDARRRARAGAPAAAVERLGALLAAARRARRRRRRRGPGGAPPAPLATEGLDAFLDALDLDAAALERLRTTLESAARRALDDDADEFFDCASSLELAFDAATPTLGTAQAPLPRPVRRRAARAALGDGAATPASGASSWPGAAAGRRRRPSPSPSRRGPRGGAGAPRPLEAVHDGADRIAARRRAGAARRRRGRRRRAAAVEPLPRRAPAAGGGEARVARFDDADDDDDGGDDAAAGALRGAPPLSSREREAATRYRVDVHRAELDLDCAASRRWRGRRRRRRAGAGRRARALPDAPTVYAVRVDEVAASVRAAPGAAVAALDVAGVDVATDGRARRSVEDATLDVDGFRLLRKRPPPAAGNLGEAVRVPDARREVAVVDEPLVVGEAAAPLGDGDGPRGSDPARAAAADAVAATLAALRRVAAALPGGPRRRRRRRTAPTRATTLADHADDGLASGSGDGGLRPRRGDGRIAGDPVELGDLAGASRRALEASVEYGSEDAASELSDGGSSDGDGDDAGRRALVAVVRGRAPELREDHVPVPATGGEGLASVSDETLRVDVRDLALQDDGDDEAAPAASTSARNVDDLVELEAAGRGRRSSAWRARGARRYDGGLGDVTVVESISRGDRKLRPAVRHWRSDGRHPRETGAKREAGLASATGATRA
ncbi:hypothetical protein SO694_00011012 [Aureococcus anophagefferens]|uniref:Chorein N-terminal domain-containing protein n=1 Tax=Aureococcus anophagefferens TaxID=44056 RepID=A0ABR1GF61_AURAN